MCKLMHKEVLQVSCRYLTRFVSYRENPGGGIFTPPSAARVNPRPGFMEEAILPPPPNLNIVPTPLVL